MTYVVPSLARLPRNVVLYKIVLYFNKSFSTLALTLHLLSVLYLGTLHFDNNVATGCISVQQSTLQPMFSISIHIKPSPTCNKRYITTVVVSSMLNNVFDMLNNANNVNGLTTV